MNREIAAILRDVANGEIGPAIQHRAKAVLEFRKKTARVAQLRSLMPIPHLTAEAERREKAKREEKAAKMRMRGEVWATNLALSSDFSAPHGRCDCGCRYAFRFTAEGECDHWISRSQGGEHTAANGWRLRASCHLQKTDEKPTRAEWNDRRRRYCELAGIPYVERRTKP